MKAKIKILWILLCGILLFSMTGCGSKDDEASGGNGASQAEDNQQKQSVQISAVDQYYDDGIALVRVVEEEDGENVTNYYIADENGNLSEYDRPDSMNNLFTMNGYLLYNSYTGTPDTSSSSDGEIYNNKGEIVYSSSLDCRYGNISKKGNIIAMKTIDSLAGESYKTMLLDKDGNEIFSVDGNTYAGWLTDEIFYISDEEGYNLIDADTKKVVHVDKSYAIGEDIKSSYGYIIVASKIYDTNLNLVYDAEPNGGVSEVLNDDYYFVSNTSGGKICSLKDGREVYNFEEGGITKIYYYDGTYYVRSKTDYLYTLDKDFKIVAEPREEIASDLLLTSEGVISNLQGYCILDENLECKTEIGYGSEIGTINWDTSDINSEYIYLTKEDDNGKKSVNVYNLKTKQYVEFKKI